jgi:hypothetical protein
MTIKNMKKLFIFIIIVVVILGLAGLVYYQFFNAPHYNLQKGKIITIPTTSFVIRIPGGSYSFRKNVDDTYLSINHLITLRNDMSQYNEDIYLCKNNLIHRADWADRVEPYMTDAYCKKLLAAKTQELQEDSMGNLPGDIYIAKVATNSSPYEWLLDNYHPQGTNLRDAQNAVFIPTGMTVTINGKIFYAYTVGCCGGSENVYFYPYTENDQHYLLLFIDTSSAIARIPMPDPFLNTILATFKTK